MDIFDPCEFSDHCAMFVSMCVTECAIDESEKFTDKLFWDSGKSESLIDIS